MTIAWLPAASAQQCVVYVTVAGGQKLQFTVDVPPGTPVSSIPLPVKPPISSVTESCPMSAAAKATTNATSSTPTTTPVHTTPTTSTTTTTTRQIPPTP